MTSDQTCMDTAIDALRPIKVICIGAGYSGILAAIQFPFKIANLQLTIYEKNDDIGGTWYENNYPGVGCDVPAHVYQYTFAGNPNWSSFYASGAEIQQYLKDVAHRYDVEKYVRLEHLFQRADWDEKTQNWKVVVKDLKTNEIRTDTADILIKATGLLNKWDWPNIKGLHSFKGDVMHTAGWNANFDWTDKRVALIGAGSSAIQVLPHIQPKSRQIYHYVRSKTWISPAGYAAEVGGGLNHDYTTEQRRQFADNPREYLEYRHRLEGAMNRSQLSTFFGSEVQKAFWAESIDFMKKKLEKRKDIYEAMLPDFPPGCRRLSPGPGYLEALMEDNVEFIRGGVEEVTETGVIDDRGVFREVDAIICATGFDYSWETGETPITGRDGTTLSEMWKPDPESYMAVAIPKLPNFFTIFGPSGSPGSGSFITMMEFVVEYIIKCIQKLQREHIASMEPTMEALKAFNAHSDSYFRKTIFTYPCRSWFKRNTVDGRVTGIWPGSSVHAQRALQNPRWEDYRYTMLPETEINPFSWLGNGLTVAQMSGGKTTEYLDTVEVPPIIRKTSRATTHTSCNGCDHTVPYQDKEALISASVSTLPS